LEYLQALEAYLILLEAREYFLKITSFPDLHLDKATNSKMVNLQTLYLELLKVYLAFPQEYLLLKNRHPNLLPLNLVMLKETMEIKEIVNK
jgi:hypothetical protein